MSRFSKSMRGHQPVNRNASKAFISGDGFFGTRIVSAQINCSPKGKLRRGIDTYDLIFTRHIHTIFRQAWSARYGITCIESGIVEVQCKLIPELIIIVLRVCCTDHADIAFLRHSLLHQSVPLSDPLFLFENIHTLHYLKESPLHCSLVDMTQRYRFPHAILALRLPAKFLQEPLCILPQREAFLHSDSNMVCHHPYNRALLAAHRHKSFRNRDL